LLDTGELPRARALFDESLALSQDLGDRIGLARSLEAFASLAALTGRVEEASQLAASAAELREANQIPLSPPERAQLERRMESMTHAPADHLSSPLKVSGHTLPLDEAVVLAHAIGKAGEDTSPGPTRRARVMSRVASTIRHRWELARRVASMG
jgi:hypothetical protein